MLQDVYFLLILYLRR